LVSKGGEIFSFGVNHDARVTITQAIIVDKEVDIHGVYIARGTFPLALKLLSDHQDLFAKVVSHRIPLSEWERAKSLLMSGQAPGKILITMGPK
jgi:threonine dehydrogenase-like Zn-dependent dehydrogenase